MKKILFYLAILFVCCCWYSCEKPSPDATLKSIYINGEKLKNFSSDILLYDVQLPLGSKVVPKVEVETTSPNAIAEIKLPQSIPGKATIDITAEDGKTKQTYTINFVFAYNSDATIQSIFINDEELEGFNSQIFSYETEVPSRSINYPKIDVITTSPNATVEITRKTPESGRLKYFPQEVIITVTAEDRLTRNIYTIMITEAPLIVDLSPSGAIDGHDYVDLGLSVKWATCNVGANQIEEIGDYFAWGETEPYNRALTAKNYMYAFNRCSPDNILSSVFDAVSKNWSKSWRMPTLEEQEELIYNCDWFWVDNINNSSISGYYVVSKQNNKAIFLPLGGYIPHEEYMNNTMDRGHYWSSWAGLGDQWKVNLEGACMRFIILDSELDQGGFPAMWDYKNRADGLNVRGVVGDANEYIPDVEFTLDEVETEKQGVSVSGKIGNHTYVDLGLPSRTMWATYNVGATHPNQYGSFYAWGETETKDIYSYSNYEFIKNGDYTKYVFYNHHGTPDAKLTLDLEDDAATVNWGADWCMPTLEQWTELANYCKFSLINLTENGVAGFAYVGTSKINGHKIYIPAAGWEYEQVPNNHFFAWYWSSNLSTLTDAEANYMTFDDNINMIIMDTYRYQGLSVRAVVKERK